MLLAQDLPVDPAELAETIGTLTATSQMVYIIVLLVIVQMVFMGGFVIWVRSAGKNSSQDNELHSKHLDTLKDNNKTMLTMVGEFAKSTATFAATVHYWGRDRAAIQRLAQSYEGLKADVSHIKQRMDKGSTHLE
jgi:hypothetical protein